MSLASDDVCRGRGERPKAMGELGKRFAEARRMTGPAAGDSLPTREQGHRADLECEANRFGLSVTQFRIQADIRWSYHAKPLGRIAGPVPHTFRSPLV